MSKIILTRIGGRAGAPAVFDLNDTQEIVAGRDEHCAVKYDPDADDLVSRRHMKIVASPGCGSGFMVVDLQSRNGTFVNKQRVTSSACLHHLDHIQLGAGGPELRFELQDAPKSVASHLTREAALPIASAPSGVGRATVERMLGENFSRVKRESAKTTWVAVGGIVAVLIVGIGLLLYLRGISAQSSLAAEQQKILLEEMDQETSTTPTQTAKMQAQVAGLEDQLKKTLMENKQNLDRITKGGGSANSAPTANSAVVPAPESNSYNAQLSVAVEQFSTGALPDALRTCSALIKVDAQRWEAYALAGRVLHAANHNDQASTFLARAEELAPVPTKPAIQQMMAQVSASAQPQVQPTPPPAPPVPQSQPIAPPVAVAPTAGPPPQAAPAQTDAQEQADDDKQSQIEDLQRDYSQNEDDANIIENSVEEYGSCTGMFSSICDAHNASQLRKAKEDRQQMEKDARKLAALGATPDSN